MLSVIIPGRNEEFMAHTVADVLSHSSESTEVIAIADGAWADPPLQDHPRLQVIHFTESVGQRAATNAGARLSRAKYIMKLDAHCSTDDGFDVKMLAKMQPDWTMIPMMHRLEAFNWMCECGERTYQGAKPTKCEECGGTDFTMYMVWQPRVQYEPTVSWRFDSTLHFQYWRKHRKRNRVRKWAKKYGIIPTMSCIGCCFLMERERFWELGGMDEGHGSWGNFGTELSAKAWLSGGKLVTCMETFISHLFRTGNFAKNNQSSWPYPISQTSIDKARAYSRDLWLNNRWEKQKYPLSWLVEQFWPVPGWTDADLKNQKAREHGFKGVE